jgi:transglutaminase-like putative cysteine protease
MAATAASLPGDASDVALAAAFGCVVRMAGTVNVAGEAHPDYRVTCADNAQALRLLDRLATKDARTSARVVALAQALRGASDEETAKAIQRYVGHAIRFVRDASQVFRSSDVTLAMGSGNCANTARLVAAIARAAGIPAKLGPVVDDDGAIVHVAAQLYTGGAWHWAEGTVPGAEYGESPYAVARAMFGGTLPFAA